MGPRIPDGCHPYAVSSWPGTARNERQRRPTDCAGRGPAAPSSASRRCPSGSNGADVPSDAVRFAGTGDNHDTASRDAVTVDHPDVGPPDGIPGPNPIFAAFRSAHDHAHRDSHEYVVSVVGRTDIQSSTAAPDAQPITDERAGIVILIVPTVRSSDCLPGSPSVAALWR